MTTNCQPSVNRVSKMVPEGGFEPPTRGFSILLKARFSAAPNVNRAKYRVNHFKYIANGVQTKMHRSDPSRVKRLTIPHFRQSQGICRGSSGLETAGMRYSVLSNTAVLPRGGMA